MNLVENNCVENRFLDWKTPDVIKRPGVECQQTRALAVTCTWLSHYPLTGRERRKANNAGFLSWDKSTVYGVAPNRVNGKYVEDVAESYAGKIRQANQASSASLSLFPTLVWLIYFLPPEHARLCMYMVRWRLQRHRKNRRTVLQPHQWPFIWWYRERILLSHIKGA